MSPENEQPVLAHLQHETGREQTLAEHSRGVAQFCETECGKIGLAALGRLTGLLHDSGKGTRTFQEYLRGGDASQRGQIPHAFCGARYCCETWGLGGTIGGVTAQLVAAAVCGHHGGLPDLTEVTGEDGLHRRVWPEKKVYYEEALRAYFRECASPEELEKLFEEAKREVAGKNIELLKLCEKVPQDSRNSLFFFLWGMLQRYLISCLIDADRYDTFLFESQETPPPEPDLPALWRALAARLEQHLSLFPSETPIDRKRREISEQCLSFAPNGGGIYRLSVPTGSGKTMSSLRYALNCAAETGKERIFYVAPYKSILDQNAKEIREALQEFPGDPRIDRILLEHHSDVVLDDDNREEVKRYSLLTQRWDAPLILTTAVQFLNTLFEGRSGCVRRMHSLARSVIILDEVQAIPVKCTYLLDAALNFLAYSCGCAVVLCTATQPSTEELKIPVIPGEPAQMTANLEETFEAFRRTRVEDKTAEGPLSAEQLADFALGRLTECDSLLAIVNTKSAAAALFRALQERTETLPQEERIPVYFLSTSLCPQHRMDRIAEIRAKLADKTPGANRLICVSTQLIEAGVNVSFQCVIRSLAGLDSIAQAAGRCNRHSEEDCRDVFIVKCAEESLASLPDIQKAQEAAEHVLQDFRSNSEQFGNDLLCPGAVRRYYHYHFALQENRLAYPADQKDDPELYAPTSLFDLLSLNSLARKSCREHSVSLPQHPLHQAFATAGGIFEAIEKGGLDAVVPYGEGEALIAELNANPEIWELPKLLRRAQLYSVHLFDGERRKLEALGAMYSPPGTGVTVLRGEFYDKSLGVQTRRGEMEPLFG